MDIYALYIAIGLFTGILSGIFGIGGGLIIVPIMLAAGILLKNPLGFPFCKWRFHRSWDLF